ncbi:MAG: T9SS type A sorting domain-containing protein [bacterium]|nr:T9SS type A sorting domain-containing protein [bacterium]
MDASNSILELDSREGDALRFNVEIAKLEAIDVSTPEGQFTQLIIPGFHASQVMGSPELPMMNRLVEIPFGARAEVEILSSRTREINLADYGITNRLLPAQPSMPKNVDPADWPFIYEAASYRAEPIAQDLVKVVEIGTLRSVQYGRLEVSPVAYYPGQNKLVVTEAIEFRVNFTGVNLSREAHYKAVTASPFFNHLYEGFAGARSLHDDHPDHAGDIASLVIVTPPEFEAQLADFVDWKTQRGLLVTMAVKGTPEVGSSKESIQAYLHGLYNNATPEAPAPTFVLFVGDVAQIPAWTESGYTTDRPYCALPGDHIPDMYYGRFSATNPTMLQAMIDKTLMYEQFAMPDPSYLSEVVMTAGWDTGFGDSHGNGQINYGTEHYFNAAHNITSHTYLYPECGSSAAAIIQNVSDGVSFVNYTAHGGVTYWVDPEFNQTDLNNLDNYGKYCLAVGNCCVTGSFGADECFGETWLRVADKGGIGYIGASMNTQWNEDYWWGVGFHSSSEIDGSAIPYEDSGLGAYDGIFHDHGEAMTQWYITNDAIVFSGNLAVSQSGTSSANNYWTTYNLQGDPSLSLWIGTPQANPVSHPAAIMATMSELTITAPPNSYCGLTVDGNLIAAGTVGSSGSLNLEFMEDVEPGIAHLVVMSQFRVPHVADISILPPEGPYLVYSNAIVDDSAGTGDADGILDADENVALGVRLENIGVETATGITAVLSCSSEYVTVPHDTESYTNIPASGFGVNGVGFGVRVGNNAPDGHMVTFDLAITSDAGDWDIDFTLPIEAPVLSAGALGINDGTGGNGSGSADAGETFQLQVTLLNDGHSDASALFGTLTSLDDNVVINAANATCVLVPEGGQGAIGYFQVEVLGGCPEPSIMPLQLYIEGGCEATIDFDLPVGGWFDDFETDRNWTVSGNASAGVWERVDPRGTTYESQNVQMENDHTPAPGTDCFVTGNGSIGGSAGENDVDGGATILTSPVFHLSEATSATVSYWRWYTNTAGNNPDEDWWQVEVTSNGSTWVSLENTQASDPSWTQFSFNLTDYITLSDNVQFRFTAADEDGGTLVEAGVDDFLLDAAYGLTTAVDDEVIPNGRLSLGPNYPNPFNPNTTISFTLPAAGRVKLAVFDVQGRQIKTLVSGNMAAGAHEIVWQGRDDAGHQVASGLYFTRLICDSRTLTHKMLMLK